MLMTISGAKERTLRGRGQGLVLYPKRMVLYPKGSDAHVAMSSRCSLIAANAPTLLIGVARAASGAMVSRARPALVVRAKGREAVGDGTGQAMGLD